MKRPKPDVGDTVLASFISNVGGIRKLRRLWGVEGSLVNGHEVLTHRQYYHRESQRSANFEKLFKYLGAYEDVQDADMDGIKSAFFYFNKNKATELPAGVKVYENFVADNLNIMWWDTVADGPAPPGLTLTTSIVIEAETNNQARKTGLTLTDILDPDPNVMSRAARITAVTDNYEALWNTCHIMQQGIGVINKGTVMDPVLLTETPDEDDLSPDDPWLSTMARYALRDNGMTCTVKDVFVNLGKVVNGQLYPTYEVVLEIPYALVNENTAMVEDIATDLTADYYKRARSRTRMSFPNGYWTQKLIKALDSSDLEDNPDLITRPYDYWEDAGVEASATYDALWTNVGRKWYLKAAVFDNPRDFGLTFKELNEYVLPLIDSDYRKKDVPWYKKVIAIIVAVAAVILAGPTGGQSLTAAQAFAVYILAVAFTLTLFTLVLGAIGQHEWAMAFSAANEFIEPLTLIASVYMIVTSFITAYDKAAARLSEEAATGAAEATIGEVLIEMVSPSLEGILSGVVDDVTNLVAGNVGQVSLEFYTKLVKLLTMPMELELKQINDRNKDLRAEYEKLAEETARESDVLQGFMNIYGKPATADWSMYAHLFDLPYERVQGTLALGNIQRTSFQAMRKGVYTDPIFDGILGTKQGVYA